jgi:hypothetical protein
MTLTTGTAIPSLVIKTFADHAPVQVLTITFVRRAFFVAALRGRSRALDQRASRQKSMAR